MNDRPDLKTIKVAAIRQLDLKIASIERIRETLGPIAKGFVHNSPIIEAGTDIRRGRIVSDRPSLLGDLSYPPGKVVTKLGRLNRIGSSLFYGSVSMHAPFYEVNPAPGDHVVVSRWRNARNLLVNNVGYSEANFVA